MRFELKSIPVWPFIRIAFFCNLIAGVIIGLLYIPLLGVMMQAMSQSPLFGGEDLGAENVSFGILVIIVPIFMAFFTGFFWTLFELVMVGIYNLLARMVGGIELNLQSVAEAPAPSPVSRPMYAETSAPTYGQSSIPPPPPPPPTESYRPAPPPPPPTGDFSSAPPPPAPEADAGRKWPSPLEPKDRDNNESV